MRLRIASGQGRDKIVRKGNLLSGCVEHFFAVGGEVDVLGAGGGNREQFVWKLEEELFFALDDFIFPGIEKKGELDGGVGEAGASSEGVDREEVSGIGERGHDLIGVWGPEDLGIGVVGI